MPLIQRFTATTQGAMVLLGNALSISSDLPYPTTSPVLNGSYVSTNTALIAQPGFPPGTTFDPTQASAAAVLNMPAGSTVLYAQLFWVSRGPTPDQNITLQLPDNTIQSIAPDLALNQQVGVNFWRAQDVTALVNAAGAGTYTVSNLPGVTLNNGRNYASSNGWWMILVYNNPSLPYRYFNVNTGFSLAETLPYRRVQTKQL